MMSSETSTLLCHSRSFSKGKFPIQSSAACMMVSPIYGLVKSRVDGAGYLAFGTV